MTDLDDSIIDYINTDTIKIQNLNKIFIVSWKRMTNEGRYSLVLKRKDNKYCIDSETSRLVRIWSYIFPDSRENYLVEKIWSYMKKQKKLKYTFNLHYCNKKRSECSNNGHCINRFFLRNLKGNPITQLINTKYNETVTRNGKDHNDEMELKTARYLKYNMDFNKQQINGINSGFKNWITNKDIDTIVSLSDLFKLLYGKNSAAEDPIKARAFLTMWQNFSVIFPGTNNVVMKFIRSRNNKFNRAAIVYFFNEDIEYDLINERLESIASNVALMIYDYTEVVDFKSEEISVWDNVKEDTLWKKILFNNIDKALPDSFKRFARIICQLADSKHEGLNTQYTLIYGSDQIWPIIEEIISLKFNDNYNHNLIEEQIADLCKSNYSIFQIRDVAGFYDKDAYSINKIVRLRYPTQEEIRKKGTIIADQDDWFCWLINKVHEVIDEKDEGNVFIANSQGKGKICFYGRDKNIEEEKGSLLLVWDVRKGNVYEPINNDTKNSIETILKEAIPQISHNEINNILNSIRKISSVSGEGACLVIAPNENTIKKYIRSMEIKKPTWLKTLDIFDPQYLLKSAFIMDGACIITPINIDSRQVIYPHDKNGAWGLENILTINLPPDKKFDKEKLIGKGSKTHTAANFTTLEAINTDLLKPKVNVITISADGPIKLWPDEILENI